MITLQTLFSTPDSVTSLANASSQVHETAFGLGLPWQRGNLLNCADPPTLTQQLLGWGRVNTDLESSGVGREGRAFSALICFLTRTRGHSGWGLTAAFPSVRCGNGRQQLRPPRLYFICFITNRRDSSLHAPRLLGSGWESSVPAYEG